MIGRRALLVLAAVAVWGKPEGLPYVQSDTPQTFRAGTDAVTVDVAVRLADKAVTGLTADDFVLLDNGVRQRIDTVDSAPVPLDVTLVLDLSGDQRGLWVDPIDPAAAATGVNERVRQIAQMLRPEDRLRVVASETYGTEIIARQPASSIAPLRQVRSGGLASLYDTLVGALLQPVEPSRRHVVLVATKGKDTVSATTATAVRFIASRSDVLLHVVMLETEADNEETRHTVQCTGLTKDVALGLCWPTRRFWVPLMRNTMSAVPVGGGGFTHPLLPDGLTLAEAATLTGGALHQASMLTEPTPAGVFRQAFDEFRQSYQLRFTPQGVRRDGWHALTVSVPGAPNATVRARRGYAIAAPAPPPKQYATSPAPNVSRAPTTFDELIEAYSRDDYQAVTAALRSWPDAAPLIRRLDDTGNPWPAAPRREAALALEIAESGLFSRRQSTQDEARNLLLRFQRLIRDPLEPDVFERYWLWAELTIVQGKIRPALAEPFVRHALTRFPDEPRFLLARAIVTDQLFPFMGAVPSPAQSVIGTATPSHAASVTQQYDAAIKSPETAIEARVRLAWFLHRVGRDDDALAQLDQVQDDSSKDTVMRYLHQLFRGHIEIAKGRHDAAVQAFRAALERWPGAQSAQVALMNALVHTGRRDEAAAMAERIQTAPADGTDPWLAYWHGDYRFYLASMQTVREMIR